MSQLPLTHKKTLARLAAVQAIYSDDIRIQDRSCAKLAIDLISFYSEKLELIYSKFDSQILVPDEKHFTNLINKTIEYKSEIDENIDKFLIGDWSLKKLSGILRSLIRVAVCELKYFPNVPPKVSINEFTNISREFFNESEIGFVNSILDKIAKENNT